MSDRTIWGCAETGTYTSPYLILSGTQAPGFAIAQPFEDALTVGDTATVSVYKDAANWAVYAGATFGQGDDYYFDVAAATLLESAGTLADSDAITVLGLSPLSAITETLAADRDYYVATTGSDANDGLTAETAFGSVQKAIDVAASLVIGGWSVIVHIADGTYYGSLTIPPLSGIPLELIADRTGGVPVRHPLKLTGNTTTPANVVLQGEFAITAESPGARCAIEGITLSGGYWNVLAANGAMLNLGHIVFGGNVYHAHCEVFAGGRVILSNNCAITASSPAFAKCYSGGRVEFPAAITVTLTGTPAFSLAFAHVRECGLFAIRDSVTFSGSATGKRYDVETNGVVLANSLTLPGGTSGTTATGGQYVA